jgi:hypothetical protein
MITDFPAVGFSAGGFLKDGQHALSLQCSLEGSIFRWVGQK